MTAEQRAELLADKRRCGVFLDAGGAEPDLSLQLVVLDPGPTVDRSSLLATLGRALNFPPWYGHNLDAAWDCLTELSWPSGTLFVLSLALPEGAEVVEPDLARFLGLLDDACRYHAAGDHALCVLVHADPARHPGLDRLPRLGDP